MRVSFAIGLLLLVIAGCGQPTPELRDVSAKPASDSQRDTGSQTRAERSEGGWPHTTKNHGGEFVYVAPDGTEKVLSLGDETVATISGKLNEAQTNEIAYELRYIQHRAGKDYYEISYQTGPHRRTTVGPFGYAGKEMPIGNKGDHGTFMLRPASP